MIGSTRAKNVVPSPGLPTINMAGSPANGNTCLACALLGVMPEMSIEEPLGVTRIELYVSFLERCVVTLWMRDKANITLDGFLHKPFIFFVFLKDVPEARF
jgi:predicted ATPase with chaperone activity